MAAAAPQIRAATVVQTPPPAPSNLGLLVVIMVCLFAARADRAYKKAGGVRPDKFEKRLLLGTVLACIVGEYLLFLRSPGASGTLAPVLIVVIFGSWEINRYRIRRKNPLNRLMK